MSTRELIILLLGLAIVAVILRGLYVALRARRSQIKLAIDKNIPNDIDLEALELAELPSGGARVVERSLAVVNSQNSEIEAANVRAASLDLGMEEEKSIPILMDPVELGEGMDAAKEEISAAELTDYSLNEAIHSDVGEPSKSFEDADSALFNYGYDRQSSMEAVGEYEDEDLEEDAPTRVYEEDGMSSVIPDYPEDEWAYDQGDEDEIPDGFHEEDFSGESYSDDQEWDHKTKYGKEIDEEFVSDDEIIAVFKGKQASDHFDEESKFDDIDGYDFDDEDEADVEEMENQEAASGTSFEESLNEFSMTAGERIGYSESAGKEINRTELLKEDEFESDEGDASVRDHTGLRSFISGFGRLRKEEDEKRTMLDHSAGLEKNITDVLNPGREKINKNTEKGVDNAISKSSTAEESRTLKETVSGEYAFQHSEVLVINILAEESKNFEGNDLLEALITSGLKFGEMNIFHHRLNNGNKAPIIFSVANILNPGTFDLNDMGNFSTIGVSLFLALPTQINNLVAFEKMLEVALKICDTLGGELKDDHRNIMTAQTIEHYRQRIRDFELKQLKIASSRA